MGEEIQLWRVELVNTISAVSYVYAPDKEEAERIAQEEAPQADFGYSNFDTDEWEVDGEAELAPDDASPSDWFDQEYEPEEEDEDDNA